MNATHLHPQIGECALHPPGKLGTFERSAAGQALGVGKQLRGSLALASLLFCELHTSLSVLRS